MVSLDQEQLLSQKEEYRMEPEAQSGADLFFQAALHYGYRYIFGNPGTTEAVFMDALVRYPDLRFVLCLHENVATGAADGLARLSGWPALVNLHLAPGLTNGLANVHNAWKARVPMVVTVGEHDTRHLLEDSPLHGDIEQLARAMCKWVWRVQDAGELAAALHRATTLAMTPPQGPTCLILPTNILTAPARTASDSVPTIPELYLSERGPAAGSDITRASEALLKAQRPMVLVGDISPAALDSVRTLANLLHAQVVYNNFPRKLDGRPLPNSQRLPYFPEQRRALLKDIDVLFLIGVGGFTTLFMYAYDPDPVVASSTQVIHLDDDAEALGKNERSSLPLYGDIAASLELLIATLRERLPKTRQAMELPTPAQAATIASARSAFSPDGDSPLTASLLMQGLAQVLPADTILIDEAVTAREALIQKVLNGCEAVTTYLSSRGGALGAALPLAIGAQLGARQRPVVAVVGDGSAMYSIQALWTAAHYRLPILTIICNNASYDIIKLEMLRLRGTLAQDGKALQSVVGLGEPRLDFAHLAQGMGVASWVVREAGQLLPALHKALEMCKTGMPALVDVHLMALPIPG